MRYILNNEGYIETISFDNEITCNGKTCTKYTGTVPEGYSSLAEWSEKAVIQAYKITNGNLTHDPNKETALLSKWEEQTGQKTLWSGDLVMHGSQTVDLSKTPISSQPNGIVLVFSAYVNEEPGDYQFVTHFVPKQFVSLKNGCGVCFGMQSIDFHYVGSKYLYIYNDKIVGNDTNDNLGTGGSNIVYNNAHWCLRYVIGV